MPTESDKHRRIREERHSRRGHGAISAIAEAQHGVIGHEQLGLTKDEIARRRGAHHLLEIHRRVYAVGYQPLTLKGRWMAAVLAVGEGALLSHQSAAMLWGLIPEAEGEVHATAPGQRRGHAGVVV